MRPTDTPRGRTGFELLLWKGIARAWRRSTPSRRPRWASPKAIDALVAEGNIDAAKINLKTLHYMVYLGRP